MSNPSICIPKVDRNITKKFIYDVFNRHLLGKIKKIDMIPNKKYFRVFIHFDYWYNTEKSLKVKEILANNLDFKIMYVEPWFWKCINVY